MNSPGGGGSGVGDGTGVASSYQSVAVGAASSVVSSWTIALATSSASYSGTIVAHAGALITPSATIAPTAIAVVLRRRPAGDRPS